MTYRDVLTALRNDLSKFNPNELVIVSYNSTTHSLQFTQLNITVVAGYLTPFFLPKRGFKFGVLTQAGLNKLQYELEQLLKDQKIDDHEYIPDLVELGTNWYYSNRQSPVPLVIHKLNYCNVRNRLLTWFLCNHFNGSSKLLYRLFKKSK